MRMCNMNTTNWQNFKLKDIFEIYTSSDKNYLESEDGNIPYVSSTRFNNGVSSFVQSDITPNENTITVARNGSVGSAFYHSYNYCASPDDVRIFKPKFEMNKYIAIFLCTLIEKEKYRFAYGRKFGTKRMQIITIKLPVKRDNIIDWQWIEDYVKNTLVPKLPQKARSVWNNNFDKGKISNKILPLNTGNWEWFKIADIFRLEKCKCSNATELLEDGNDIAYIGAKKKENGFMKNVLLVPKLITKGNCIIFIGDGQGSVGYCTYQPVDFIGSTTLTAGYSPFLNQYNALFFIAVLDMERYRYSFGRKYGYKVVKETKIKLPAKNEQPDFEFMENYIKALNYSNAL